MKYKIWNKKDSLITPIGEVLTAEQVLEKYPAAALEGAKYIICDTPVQLGVFMEYETTKIMYKQMGAAITDKMNEKEVLEAISYFEEHPPVPEPTAEERIAAQLEFQNMINL